MCEQEQVHSPLHWVSCLSNVPMGQKGLYKMSKALSASDSPIRATSSFSQSSAVHKAPHRFHSHLRSRNSNATYESGLGLSRARAHSHMCTYSSRLALGECTPISPQICQVLLHFLCRPEQSPESRVLSSLCKHLQGIPHLTHSYLPLGPWQAFALKQQFALLTCPSLPHKMACCQSCLSRLSLRGAPTCLQIS